MCVCSNNLFLQIEDGEKFNYRVKVINPKAKESTVIDWHGITEKFITVADLKEKLVNTVHIFPSCLMNLMLDIFMADHKPKAGFSLNMTFKLCMALGARKFSCVMERAKIRAENNARKQMMKRKVTRCQLSASVQNLQVLKKKSLKKEFISGNQSMLMIMTMANTDCGRG